MLQQHFLTILFSFLRGGSFVLIAPFCSCFFCSERVLSRTWILLCVPFCTVEVQGETLPNFLPGVFVYVFAGICRLGFVFRVYFGKYTLQHFFLVVGMDLLFV